MQTVSATIHLAFAFDVGYEIDLDGARALLSAEDGTLPRRKRTPESIRYRPAPLRLAVDPAGITLPRGLESVASPRAELSLFDFGALSLMVHVPVCGTLEEISSAVSELADPTEITEAARAIVAPWIRRLVPAIIGYEWSALSEEYIVVQLGEVGPNWLHEHASWVAGLLRLEPGALSPEEVAEATRLSISYAPNDLVVLDWAAALVADRDCADTLQVIEFANVQLLEFRHIDDRLDDRLEAAYRLIRRDRPRGKLRLPWRTHEEAVRNVRELEIEATSLFERADNALKLIGDQYLSRVYALVSTRFHLGEWQQSIRRKLDTVGDVYDLLVQQAGGTRMEVLEIIVVVLIALEIVLAVVRH
ncbi:MAG: hypothetical protein JWQ01_4676 [Massilia sp.]|nr:hypothetical protein [Planctomycetota bacterium]MDB5937332.1 hypothetical protein [Massilia sp.]